MVQIFVRFYLQILIVGLKIHIFGLKIHIFCLKIGIFCLKIRIFGLKIRIFGLKIRIFGLKIHIFGYRYSYNILYACFQRMPETISILAAGLTVLAAGTLEFMSSFCQYLPRD